MGGVTANRPFPSVDIPVVADDAAAGGFRKRPHTLRPKVPLKVAPTDGPGPSAATCLGVTTVGAIPWEPYLPDPSSPLDSLLCPPCPVGVVVVVDPVVDPDDESSEPPHEPATIARVATVAATRRRGVKARRANARPDGDALLTAPSWMLDRHRHRVGGPERRRDDGHLSP